LQVLIITEERKQKAGRFLEACHQDKVSSLSRLGSLCFLVQVVCRHEEYNSILSTLTDADKIGCFGLYWHIGKT